jgi:hypothetical protein
MSGSKGPYGLLKFTIILLFLIAVSLVGMIAPESVSRLQDSNLLRWSVAILCGLTFSYILVWLSTAVTDAGNLQLQDFGHYLRDKMITDLRRVLYFQPLIGLLVGWILGWDVNRIISVVSFLNFLTVCVSFFGALKQRELSKKKLDSFTNVGQRFHRELQQ